MRWLLVIFVFLCVTPSHARQMRLTIYDDGLSCPGNCDAHVVFAPVENGTRYAFRPDSTRAQPKKCVAGEECTICFDESDKSCMRTRYRGNGPETGRFDFTPAFYAENCTVQQIPEALKRECSSLDRAAKQLGYVDAVNCFEKNEDPQCVKLITKSRAAQEADVPKRDKCLSKGQAAYNSEQTDPRERRANDCNYSDLRLGGKPGHRWRLLLPAACRPGTFVDKFGLDCCSKDIRFAAANHPECKAFFPK